MIATCPNCNDDWFQDEEAGTRDDELGDVLAFFKQLEVDAERFGKPVELKDAVERLTSGEHRR